MGDSIYLIGVNSPRDGRYKNDGRQLHVESRWLHSGCLRNEDRRKWQQRVERCPVLFGTWIGVYRTPGNLKKNIALFVNNKIPASAHVENTRPRNHRPFMGGSVIAYCHGCRFIHLLRQHTTRLLVVLFQSDCCLFE